MLHARAIANYCHVMRRDDVRLSCDIPQKMNSIEVKDNQTESAAPLTDTKMAASLDDPERTSLLNKQQSTESGTAYASDGETDRPVDNVPVEYAGEGGRSQEREGRGRRRPVGNSQHSDDEEEGGGGDSDPDEVTTKDSSCGLMECGRKLLNTLPDIGEGEEEGTEEYWAALRHGAKQVIQLIFPVTICMAVVLTFQLTIAANEPPSNVRLYYLPFDESTSSSGIQTFGFALINAAVFIAIIVVMTILLVCLFKYRCYKAIYVWLVVASALLLFVISAAYFVEILLVRNLILDWFSYGFFIWNFGCMGLMVIHWKGPLKLQQAYLILTSALVATVFLKYLPNWTTWIVLVAISLYDLFAVLCPKGPLRVLVETAKERDMSIFPSLIYSSTMVWIVGMADKDDSKKKKKDENKGSVPKAQPQRKQESGASRDSSGDTDEETDREAAAGEMNQSIANPDRRHGGQEGSEPSATHSGEHDEQEDSGDEPRGFKLGLGDFIFYSILVGRAAADSSGDWVIISSCFVAILIGLCMTSLILGIVRRALPALPISIFFGVIFYFSSRYLIAPFAAVLATRQVYI